MFGKENNLDIKREIVSSIGRQQDNEVIYNFICNNVFTKIPMEIKYQMFRTCLIKEEEIRFKKLGEKIKSCYNNEVINKMDNYFHYKYKNKERKVIDSKILQGDSENVLLEIENNSIQLIFTSPPYYNAREYVDYNSYNEYLAKMKRILLQCNRVLEEGRYIVINVSPIITKRAGRNFESIRYPIPYDFHKLLQETGFYFIDEIIWIKPEPSVPNRIGSYLQNKKPLTYKPNCVTETIMVYRKIVRF